MKCQKSADSFCSPVQHRIREPLNLAGTAEDPLQFEIAHSSQHTQSEVTGVGKVCGCSLNALHCRPGTTNPGLLECPWLGRSRELVQFLDARVSRLDSITSVHIRPDILHRFLDEMSRGWCYAGQPLCSDGQGAACTSCTSNF